MSGQIHVTVLEVPSPMIARYDYADAPCELLPWADPYIAQLVAKLEREGRGEAACLTRSRGDSLCEPAAPPRFLGARGFEEPEWFDGQEEDGESGFDSLA